MALSTCPVTCEGRQLDSGLLPLPTMSLSQDWCCQDPWPRSQFLCSPRSDPPLLPQGVGAGQTGL